MGKHKIALWAGIIAPVLFVAVFSIEGWLRPDYHPLSMFVSALSLGPRGWIQITNFVVYGLLSLVFAIGVARAYKNGKKSLCGPTILIVLGTCYLLSGIFVMDPRFTLPSNATVHGILHGMFGAIIFVLMPICSYVFFRRFQKDAMWHSFQSWTLIATIIISIAVILLIVATKIPSTQISLNAWVGLIQRLSIIPYALWVFTFAFALRRRLAP